MHSRFHLLHAAGAAAAALLLLAMPADAQRRRAPGLTEETLVPTELFPQDDARRFEYPQGVEVTYFRHDAEHVWKLVEAVVVATPPPTPSPDPFAAPTPAPSPTPTPEPTLPPSGEEQAFVENVGMVRPTFVTLRFTESPAAAAELVQAFQDQVSSTETRPDKLAVFELEKGIRNLDPGAVLYNREFNLGDKSGGVRRASTIVFARGNVVVKVEAMLGLRDGAYEADFPVLQARATSVARYLLRKL